MIREVAVGTTPGESSDANREHGSVAELCRVHGVSRKTGYKWLQRFKEGGRPGLADQPRRWHAHPHATPEKVVELVVGARKQRKPTQNGRHERIHRTLKADAIQKGVSRRM